MWQAPLKTASYSGLLIVQEKPLKMADTFPTGHQKRQGLTYPYLGSVFVRLCSFVCHLNFDESPLFRKVMAESQFTSVEEDWEDDPIMSTPLKESIYSLRRKRRLDNYLSGTGRTAVSLDSNLLRSLSSNKGSVVS